MTMAPAFTISLVTKRAFPIAATRMSASRVTDGRSRVREWEIVTVAFCCRRREATGFPTIVAPADDYRARAGDFCACRSDQAHDACRRTGDENRTAKMKQTDID